MPISPEQIVAPPPPVEHSRPLTATESEDFANVLRIRPESIRTTFRADAPQAERALPSYDELVADPIKTRFASDPTFFAQIKRDVALEFLPRYFDAASRENLRVLDVGCGTGELMRSLEQSFRNVQGCDPSLSMVCRAGVNAAYMPSELQLPFDAGTFDVATCACVYHHIAPEIRLAHLAEIRRVLKPGGVLLVFEHNPRNPLTQFIVHRCPIDASAKLIGAPGMKRLFRSAGFERVRTRYYLFLPRRLYRHFGACERLFSLTTLGGQYCSIARNPG
ncbi:MAG: methyltransferase domain-containing protein [Planctomycetes bacterium]|nr:methyltransferase domain-containing protein [Planctomycetota bacterium]